MFLKLSSKKEISACQQELFSCPFSRAALQLSTYLSYVVTDKAQATRQPSTRTEELSYCHAIKVCATYPFFLFLTNKR